MRSVFQNVSVETEMAEQVKAAEVRSLVGVQRHHDGIAMIIEGDATGRIGLMFSADVAEEAALRILTALPSKPIGTIEIAAPEDLSGPLEVQSAKVARLGEDRLLFVFRIGSRQVELRLPPLGASSLLQNLAAQLLNFRRSPH
jgi:hypothetical protein